MDGPLPAVPEFYFTEELKPISTLPKRTVQFLCKVSDSQAEVKWFKSGVEITKEEVKKYEITSDGRRRSLTLHDVTPEEAAEYSCELGVHRTAAMLDVKEEPKPEGINGNKNTPKNRH